MRKKFFKSYKDLLLLLVILILFIESYFLFYKSADLSSPSQAMRKVGWWGRPSFNDDLNKESLLAAIKKNNEYLERLPSSKIFRYGDQQYSAAEVKESFKHLVSIIKTSGDESEVRKRIIKDFEIYSVVGNGGKKMAFFTGYYEPIFKGSREMTDYYRYPLYNKPDDMIRINLGGFRRSLKGKRVIARIENGAVVPYYDRKAIEQNSVLSGQGLEIAWLADPIDPFFLHIQGSGIIEMEDGSVMNVNYTAANGRDYRSIGRLLIKEGKVPKERMSMKAIREYLISYPEEMDRILNYNESYVFFKIEDKGPIGSTSVQLTAGRSIAADARFVPKGGLAFIETEIPVTDKEGNVTGWETFSGFVVDQDSGGAIKGPGRVDIFFGTGDEAGRLAGAMNRKGKLFYLIKKKSLNG